MKTQVDINHQIKNRLLQLNCWHVGDAKKFYNPNPPVVVGNWKLIKSELPGWVDIRYGRELFCYWTEEDDNCPFDADSDMLSDRVIEWLKHEIEQVRGCTNLNSKMF